MQQSNPCDYNVLYVYQISFYYIQQIMSQPFIYINTLLNTMTYRVRWRRFILLVEKWSTKLNKISYRKTNCANLQFGYVGCFDKCITIYRLIIFLKYWFKDNCVDAPENNIAEIIHTVCGDNSYRCGDDLYRCEYR